MKVEKVMVVMSDKITGLGHYCMCATVVGKRAISGLPVLYLCFRLLLIVPDIWNIEKSIINPAQPDPNQSPTGKTHLTITLTLRSARFDASTCIQHHVLPWIHISPDRIEYPVWEYRGCLQTAVACEHGCAAEWWWGVVACVRAAWLHDAGVADYVEGGCGSRAQTESWEASVSLQ